MVSKTLFVTILAAVVALAAADTPANCHGDDVLGTWEFHRTGILAKTGDNMKCPDLDDFVGKDVYYVTLAAPNLAIDEKGQKGSWTMIYNQGFEVRINGQRYFAFSNYSVDGANVTSHCHSTEVSYYHDCPNYTGVIPPENWGCYFGRMVDGVERSKSGFMLREDKTKWSHKGVAEQLNAVQSSWTARPRPDLETLSLSEVQRLFGLNRPKAYYPGSPRRGIRTEKSARTPSKLQQNKNVGGNLPESFDWRNVSGVAYNPPMRDQLSCGSCYAHATVSMLESRTRILSNLSTLVELSTQDVVSCSPYSQGCDGGFAYLVSKYAQDFGLAEELCFPYDSGIINAGFNMPEVPCGNKCKGSEASAWHVKDFDYIGGYYGACSEEAMMQEIYNNGPIAVGFEVYPDFMHYTDGIYHHVESVSSPHASFFEETNHAVTIYGWGVDAVSGEKYWAVSNSWGRHFGMTGFFNIRRGNDECGIESMGVYAVPMGPQ